MSQTAEHAVVGRGSESGRQEVPELYYFKELAGFLGGILQVKSEYVDL